MPKKKKGGNWQRDYPKKKKRGDVTGNVVAQKKKGNVTAQGKGKKNWRKHGHFCQSRKNSSLLSFLSILERKHFGGSRKKTPGPHHLFSFLPIQPNTHQKSFFSYFLFYFLSKVFHPPYFTSKQTHSQRKALGLGLFIG